MPEEDQRTNEERLEKKRAERRAEAREIATEEGLRAFAKETGEEIKRREQDLVESAREQQAGLDPLEGGMDPVELARFREESGMGRVPQIQEQAAEASQRALRAIDLVMRRPAPPAPPEAVEQRTIREERPPAEPERPAVEPEPVAERTEQFEDAALERLDRQLRLSSSVERLRNGEMLDRADRARLAGALEGRGWHNIFSNVESGEAMVAIMTPPGGETYPQSPDERLTILNDLIRSGALGDIYGDDVDGKRLDKELGFEPFGIFGVKRFNDDFFGPQRTDAIIDKRRVLVSEHLGAACTELEQSFKDGFFKLTKDQISDPDARTASIANISAAIETINAELRAFVPKMIAEAKDELIQKTIPAATEHLRGVEAKLAAAGDPAERAALVEERKDAAERRKDAAGRYAKLHLFEPIFEREGYELNFGVKDVGERSTDESGKPIETDYAHIELALTESLQAAKRAREAGEHGRAFQERDPVAIVAELKEIRERIMAEDIVDAHGVSHPIFRLEADGVTRTLNTDIVRDLRKGKFKVREGQEGILASIQDYMRHVNVLDVVKPYTHEEISGEDIYRTSFKLRDQLKTVGSISERIRSGAELTDEERQEAARTLEREGKDRTCTSAMEFHSRALGMDECTYLTLDVLDVGPNLIRDYDRLLQHVERGEMTFEEASVIAGDETTRMMRAFRDKITEVYREYTGDPEAVPAMLVGGDEATIAIDRSKVEVTDELLMKLRNATSSRVVETVVAGADRSTEPQVDETARRKEHLEAQKLAERGSELAKTLERSKRECEYGINDLPEERKVGFLDSLNKLNVRNFVVKQSDGGFKLVVEDPAEPGSGKTLPPVEFQGVFDGVEALTERVRAEAQAAHKALFEELRSAHPNLTMDAMPRVQRMKNYLEGEEEFRAYMEKYS